MFSPEFLDNVNDSDLNNYLNLICKSSSLYGSSNNLELGLHVLHYFKGDVEESIKSFLNQSIDLPKNHPLTTYKYNETDVWSKDEITKFEVAILKHDKIFSEISKEV
jgi:hypothetical protein